MILFRFHLRAGARLALRAMVPLVAPVVALAGLSPKPWEFFLGLSAAVALPAADPAGPIIVAAGAAGLAAWVASRITRTLHGWILHLPAGAREQRRAAAAALAAAQAPYLIFVAALFLYGLAGGLPISVPRLLGLPLLALAAAYAALPVRGRIWILPASVAALLLAVVGSWIGLGGAALLLLAVDRFCGDLRRSRRGLPRYGLVAWAIEARIAWRSLGTRTLGIFLTPILPLAAAAFFASNNPVDPRVAVAAARLGCALAVTLLLAALAEALSRRRPVWPWARSLPRSSEQRALADGIFLGLHALPLLAVVTFLDRRAAATCLAILPLLALRAAAVMRRTGGPAFGPSTRILIEGFLISGIWALVPWIGWAALLAAPLALRFAARKDREVRITRWEERRPATPGDDLSWSAP